MFFVLDFIVHYLLHVLAPNRWPSSGNMYIKYAKVTAVYVNRSIEIAA
jgi:hypothetical protein